MSESEAELRVRVRALEARVEELQRALHPANEGMPGTRFRALTLTVDGVRFALPVDCIREVVPLVWPTRLPEAPPFVLGTFRYERRVVPMVDLRLRLFGTPTAMTLDGVLVILERPRWLGLVTSVPDEVVEIEPDQIAPIAPGVRHAPFLVGSIPSIGPGGTHLVAISTLGRELEVHAP